MKMRNAFLLLIIFSVAAGIFLPLPSARAQRAQEEEFILKQEQATLSQSGMALNAEIRSFAAGYVKVQFSPMPSGLQPTVTLLNKEDNSTVKAKMGVSGTAVLPIGEGRYSVTVADESGGSSPGGFQWTLSLLDEIDSYEPNGSRDSALEIPTDRLIKIALFPYADKDCFRFSLDEAGEVKLNFQDAPKEVNPTFTMYDGAGNKIPFESESGFLDKGNYVVCIEDKIGRFSQEPFYFSIAYVGNLDPFEPNDSAESARPIPLDVSVPLRIFPKEDRDFFTLEFKEAGELALLFYDLPEGVRPTVMITDDKGSALSDGARPVYLSAGKYTVKFSDPGDKLLGRLFHMRFYTRKNPDPSEPNNTADQAVTTVLGADQPVLLDHQDDEDWFSVELKEPGFISELVSAFEMGGEPLSSDTAHGVRLELYDAGENLVGSFKDDWGSVETYVRSIEIKQPGRYFVRTWREKADTPPEARLSFKLYLDFLSREEFDTGKLRSGVPSDENTIVISYGMESEAGNTEKMDSRIQNMLLARKRGWRLIESGYEVEELTKAFTSAIQGPEEEEKKKPVPFLRWFVILAVLSAAAYLYRRFRPVK